MTVIATCLFRHNFANLMKVATQICTVCLLRHSMHYYVITTCNSSLSMQSRFFSQTPFPAVARLSISCT